MVCTVLTLKRITSYDIVLDHPSGWSEERLRALAMALPLELSWDAKDEDTDWEVADLIPSDHLNNETMVASLCDEDLEHLPEGDR